MDQLSAIRILEAAGRLLAHEEAAAKRDGREPCAEAQMLREEMEESARQSMRSARARAANFFQKVNEQKH